MTAYHVGLDRKVQSETPTMHQQESLDDYLLGVVERRVAELRHGLDVRKALQTDLRHFTDEQKIDFFTACSTFAARAIARLTAAEERKSVESMSKALAEAVHNARQDVQASEIIMQIIDPVDDHQIRGAIHFINKVVTPPQSSHPS